jgi:biopolymer transport protein ExbD
MKEGSVEVSLFVEKLKQLANEVEPESEEDPEREVTIMGDKEVPYKVLDRVMRLCANQAGFSKISLSVIQKETQIGSQIES